MYLVTILSGFAMFEFTNRVTKNKKIALLSAVFYVLLPYRITDMYMRIAIAELASFIFLPMVFHGIYAIIEDSKDEKNKMSLILVIGTVGLILTHTVITLYTAIFAFLYLILNIKKLKKQSILRLIYSILIVLVVTAFFWVPLLEHRLGAEYEVFQEGRMSRVDVLKYYKLDITQLLYTKDGERVYEIGIPILVGSVLAVVAIVKKKLEEENQNHTIFFLILGLICSFMTLRICPFEKLPDLFCMIQFTYRFLEFLRFFLSFAAAIGFGYLFEKFGLYDVFTIGIISFLLLVPLNRLISYQDSGWREEYLIPSFPVTENTGRVHAGCASFEYLPTKAFENMEYIKERENTTIVLLGEATIEEQKNGSNLNMQFVSNSTDLTLELPYIYYLGYRVEMKEKNETDWRVIPSQESEKGFLEINLENLETGKTYYLELSYEGTIGMKISFVISVLGTSILFIYYLIKKRENMTKKETNI